MRSTTTHSNTSDPALRAVIYEEIAGTYYTVRNFPEARKYYQEMRKGCQRLVRVDPSRVPEMLNSLAKNIEIDHAPRRYIMQGILLQESGRFSDASEAFQQALDLDPMLDSSLWGSPSP